jgi:serine/threonine protein kinase
VKDFQLPRELNGTMTDEPNNPRPPAPAGPDSKSGELMRARLERQLADAGSGEAGVAPPPVPDHELLHHIGRGAYGDVWLARNALGALRAVKVVYRARFKDDRPYEREFHGILKYEPISRSHEGLVQVLHAGRDEARGCFYYVMELADAESEQVGKWESEKVGSDRPASVSLAHFPTCPPASYSPRTLRSDLAGQERLPPVEAAQFVLRLAGALGHLHAHGLVHRDIKPSNVIFVGGQPKLADIGLVTDMGSSHSFVGTEGFIPPEGPGTPQADLYGLGKLLYELATGRDRMDFPQLPPLANLKAGRASRLPGERASASGPSALPRSAGAGGTPALLDSSADAEALLELNEVMTRACAPEPRHRYANATELQAELNLFLAGRSLRRARHVERNLARLKKFAVAACVLLALGAGALWFAGNEARHAREKEREANDRARAEAVGREKETALRRRAEAAEQQTEQQLYTALLEQARATVRSGERGQRVRALDALRRAAAISNTVELRREVFAALALPDLRFERELPAPSNFTFLELDPAFERLAIGRGNSPIELRAVSDSRLLATLPASTNLPAHSAEWSADGTFLAVKRDYASGGARADWEIWEVAPLPVPPPSHQSLRDGEGLGGGARRVLLLRAVPWGAVSFHPRLRRLMAGGARGRIAVWDLESGREAGGFQLAGEPVHLKFAPEGGRFAASYPLGAGWILSVHDATNGAPLASHAFTEYVRVCAWHPDGRWLAVADNGGAIHRMAADTGETRVVGRHRAEAVTTVFSPLALRWPYPAAPS